MKRDFVTIVTPFVDVCEFRNQSCERGDVWHFGELKVESSDENGGRNYHKSKDLDP